MRKTRISLLILFVLTLSAVPLGFLIFNAAGKTITELPNYEPTEVGPEFRNAKLPISSEISEIPVQSGLKTSVVDIGDQKLWLSADFYNGFYFYSWFELRAEGDRAQIWVQLDLAFPDGDPRALPEVTDEQVAYMLDEFEDQIIDTNEGYFGTPNFHDGVYATLNPLSIPGYYEQAEGKKVILISNIRDDSFYNSSYPSYVVGFYSPSFQNYFDRNIISIDCYAYEKRLGDEGTEWTPGVYVDRPNVYESTVAHEYQHLIHDDYHENPEAFMNEACSLFAEPLNGYELDAGQIEWFLNTPDNSLTVWGDQGDINILADYGSSFLWALFITSHYGFDFMGEYVQGEIPGIEGINLLLPEGVDFLDVFHDWRIANLVQTDSGPYAYTSFGFTFEGLDPLRVYEVEGKHFDWMLASEAFGETLAGTSTKYHTNIYEVSTFGSDYFVMDDLRGLNKFFFDGEDADNVGWQLTDYGWYSGQGDLLDYLLYTNPYTVVAGDELTINTYWDIEDNWDFGFVQVSTDGGETWTSLANAYTTDVYAQGAHPNIIANLPGLTSWSTWIFGDTEYYVYHDISFDLSAYVDQEVIFGFRYMTDWAFTYEGWYIDHAYVGDTPLELIPYYPENEIDFMVTIVVSSDHKWDEFSFDFDMWLCDSNEFGLTYLLGTKWSKLYVIVTPMMNFGYADYAFKSSNKIRHGWSYYC